MKFVNDDEATKIVTFNEEEYEKSRGRRRTKNSNKAKDQMNSSIEETGDDVSDNENIRLADLVNNIKMEFKDFQNEIRSKDLRQAGN